MRIFPKTRKHFVNCVFGVLLLAPLFAFSQKTDESNTFAVGFRCEPKSLPIHFFEDFKKEQKNGWTENVQILRSQGLTQAKLLPIIEKILGFQNSQWRNCSDAVADQILADGKQGLFYDSRLSDAETLKVTIAVGYYDQRPLIEVRDALVLPILVGQLTSECHSDLSMNCGFEIQSSGINEVYLQKTIWNNQTLLVHIFNPSLTQDDNLNRTNVDQQILSHATQKKFLDSFGDSHFVFYLGHSRNGGGPDFFPPILNRSGHTNYKEYRSKKTQINQVIQAIANLPIQKRPLVFGMSSCSSRLHFQKLLKAVLPSSVLLLSKETVFEVEDFESIMVFLNGLQLRKSVTEMNHDLQAVNIAHRMRNNQEMSSMGFFE